MASLNLPAALEDLSDRQNVPQSLIEKAQQIKDMGGIQFLSKQMNELSEHLKGNKEILDEVYLYTAYIHVTIAYILKDPFFSTHQLKA